MDKIEIKLNENLAKKGLGFYDPESKKNIKHDVGKTIIVERTSFVNAKIQTGEILVVNANPKEETEKEDKPKKDKP
jgi:hypothetical protein